MRMIIGTPDRDDVYVGTTPADLTPDVLFTYAHTRTWNPRIDWAWRDGCRIMLDSGAFSLWRGVVEPYTRDEHLSFVTTYHDALASAASLDVIGDPVATFENFVWQRARADVFPTLHAGAPLDLLDSYLSMNPPMLALGGLVRGSLSTEQKVTWCREVFRRIVDDEGRPRLPVHGFGCAWGDLFCSFPWSTTDCAVANYGAQRQALLHRRGSECFQIYVRENHYFFFGRVVQRDAPEGQMVEASLARHGFTFEEVRDHSALCLAYNIRVLRDCDGLVPERFRDVQTATLF